MNKYIKDLIEDLSMIELRFWRNIAHYYRMVKRMLFWGWHMRASWDWDAHTIYRMLYLKLDRMIYEMNTNSHCMWNRHPDTGEMRRLREARELCRRFYDYDERYDMKGFYETEARYGELIREWGEENDRGFRVYRTYWQNDEEATKYFRRRNKHWNNVAKAHKKRLFYLLEHYMDGWWD